MQVSVRTSPSLLNRSRAKTGRALDTWEDTSLHQYVVFEEKSYLRKIRRRIISSAQITQSPDCVPTNGDGHFPGQDGEETGEYALVQQQVPELGRVARNVGHGEDDLVQDFLVILFAHEHVAKYWNCASVDYLP